jgi:hypothetical protein
VKKQGLLNNEEKAASRATKQGAGLMHVDGLIEHLEDEMEPVTFDEDLELLLKNSEEDRALFESLKKTREVVKRSDDVALPESGQYYDTLHAKIMAAIEDEEIAGRGIQTAKRARRPFAWPQVFGAVGMTMMLAIVALMSLKTSHTVSPAANEVAAVSTQETFERRLAMVDPRAGAQIAHELGSFESEEDFLTETAAARLKQISAGEARAMMEDLSN